MSKSHTLLYLQGRQWAHKKLSLYALSASSAGEHLGKFKTGRGAKGRGGHRDGRKEEMEQMSRRKRRRGVKYEQDEAEHGKM